MFERLTFRARRVMEVSRTEAIRLRHTRVAPEHLLLAVLKDPTGSGVGVLTKLGVEVDLLQADLERLVHPGTLSEKMHQLPFTSRAKDVMELTIEEADALGNTSVGTAHILLALIREDGGMSGAALQGARVDLEAARREVRTVGDAEEPAGVVIRTARGALRIGRPEDDPGPALLDLLRGLLETGNEAVDDALREAGVDREALLEAIRKRISEA